MKTETLTISAKDVKAGDVTPWGIVKNDAYLESNPLGGSLATFWTNEEYRIQMHEGREITVTRPVADVRPRGRMEIGPDGFCTIGGYPIRSDQRAAVNSYLAELWNSAEESGPTRAEFVAALERARDKLDSAGYVTLANDIDAMLARCVD